MADWLNSFYTEKIIEKLHELYAEHRNVNVLKILNAGALKEFKNLKWKRCYEPMKCSYDVASPPRFVKSDEFKALITKVTGRRGKISVECRRFRKGDYTVLYDKLKPGKGVLFILNLTKMDQSWGGWSTFIRGNEEVARLIPSENALFIINNTGLRSFVKYVNHHAKQPRVFLYGVLQ